MTDIRLKHVVIALVGFGLMGCSSKNKPDVTTQDLFAHFQNDGIVVKEKVISDEEKQVTQALWQPVETFAKAYGGGMKPLPNGRLQEHEERYVDGMHIWVSRYSSKALAEKTYKHDVEFEGIHRAEGEKQGTGMSSFGFNRDFYLNGTFEMDIEFGDFTVQDGKVVRTLFNYDSASIAKLAASFSSFQAG